MTFGRFAFSTDVVKWMFRRIAYMFLNIAGVQSLFILDM